MDILELPLAQIVVKDDRARGLDTAWAEGLAAIIDAQGLQQPIRVREVGGTWRLVAGLHRLEAHRLLGRKTIPAVLSQAETDEDARLEEVMENLGRYDLIALDRCRHLFELKEAWEAKYPHTRRGGDPATKAKLQTLQSGENGEVFGFAKDNAGKIGLSWRAIMLAVKIYRDLYPSVRNRLHGTPLAHKQTELKALAELGPTQQAKVLDAILNPELPGVGNVAQALEYLTNGVTPNALEKRFQTVSRSFGSLDDETFDHVLMAHEERVIASLRRRNRI